MGRCTDAIGCRKQAAACRKVRRRMVQLVLVSDGLQMWWLYAGWCREEQLAWKLVAELGVKRICACMLV